MKQEIVNCLTWYANKMAEITQYEGWSDEFCRKKAKENTDRFLEELKKHIDWNNLTEKEAIELRFCKWDSDEDIDKEISDLRKPDARYLLNEGQTLEDKIEGLERTKGIRLIPLYLFPIIPKGIELTSISGETIVFDGQEIDNDTRFGCTAWGIKINESEANNASKN